MVENIMKTLFDKAHLMFDIQRPHLKFSAGMTNFLSETCGCINISVRTYYVLGLSKINIQAHPAYNTTIAFKLIGTDIWEIFRRMHSDLQRIQYVQL